LGHKKDTFGRVRHKKRGKKVKIVRGKWRGNGKKYLTLG
jgi:hypothetical protein